MVGQRTLTPLILVRIQVKQPIKNPPHGGFFIGYLPELKSQAVRSSFSLLKQFSPYSQRLQHDLGLVELHGYELKHIFIFFHMGDFLLAEKHLLMSEQSDSL